MTPIWGSRGPLRSNFGRLLLDEDVGGRNFTFNLRSQELTQPGLGFVQHASATCASQLLPLERGATRLRRLAADAVDRIDAARGAAITIFGTVLGIGGLFGGMR